MNAYKNLKTYVLSALASVAMMANAQAQEIGAQYRDKEAAGTAEYSFNMAKNLAITPRVEVGGQSDVSASLDYNNDKLLFYIGGGALKGEEVYPMVLGGTALKLGDKFTVYGNAAVAFGGKEESNEDPLTKLNAGLEYKTKVGGKNLALRTGLVDKIGTDESKVGADVEVGYDLTKDGKWQVSAGYEGDSVMGKLTYNFGGRKSKVPGRLYSAVLGEKTARKVVETDNEEQIIQVTTPSGGVTYVNQGGNVVTPAGTPVTQDGNTVTTPSNTGSKPYVPVPGGSQGGTDVYTGVTPTLGPQTSGDQNGQNPIDSTTITNPNQGGSNNGGGVAGYDE
jgi:hypothetical protein